MEFLSIISIYKVKIDKKQNIAEKVNWVFCLYEGQLFIFFKNNKCVVFSNLKSFKRHITCNNWTILTDFEETHFVAQKGAFASFLHLYGDGEK